MQTYNIVSWNVNGIRAVHRKGDFSSFFQRNPDLLCVQETKAQEEQLDAKILNIEGYHSYFVSAERKGYSGVALYSKVKPESVVGGFGIEEFDREGRVLVAYYPEFVVLNIYFPNGKASKERLKYKLDFYDAFLEFVDGLKDAGKNIIICGDVNTAHKEIDLARPKENEKTSGFLPEERAWIDIFLSHGYVDTLRMFNNEADQYSWWDYKTRARERNVGWRIDYFFVSDGFKENVKSADILADVMGSDHCPIQIEIGI
ncbi:MAG: exodeoxyribonuclease III [Anaerolineaceae bacterium]|nr:exodeoxyribonuclease III [Anaerolineaceae bacterium]